MPQSPLKKLSDDKFEFVALRFRALGEVNRLRIVEALHHGERSVNELVEITGMSQPNVSRHLQVLLAAGLIGRRKDAQSALYRIVDDTLGELCDLVCKSVASAQRFRQRG